MIHADLAGQDDAMPSVDPTEIIQAIRDGETVLLTDGPEVIGKVSPASELDA